MMRTAVSGDREIAREIDDRGGLADAALLIGAGDRLDPLGSQPKIIHKHKFYHFRPLHRPAGPISQAPPSSAGCDAPRA